MTMRLVAGQYTITCAANPQTMIQIQAPEHQSLYIAEFSISFSGLGIVIVDLLRQTDAGTMTAFVPQRADPNDTKAIRSICQHTATAEPGTDAILKTWRVSGLLHISWRAHKDSAIVVPAGTWLGLRADDGGAGLDAACFIEYLEGEMEA